jgi:hypothetical protein
MNHAGRSLAPPTAMERRVVHPQLAIRHPTCGTFLGGHPPLWSHQELAEATMPTHARARVHSSCLREPRSGLLAPDGVQDVPCDRERGGLVC